MIHVGILGCGWLGLPLAQELVVSGGFFVKGTVTSQEKLFALKSFGIQPYQIVLGVNSIQGDIEGFLKDISVLVIAVPPRLRNQDSESFLEKMKTLLPYIEASFLKKVIFMSSTSVYGKSIIEGDVTENSVPYPDTESGIQLLQIEALLEENSFFETVILRLGGLIGVDRNPVKQLQLKVNKDAHAPVNLLHQNDAVAIIKSFIYPKYPIGVYNVVAPWHPSRIDYYTKKATDLGLGIPIFLEDKTMEYKIISSSKLEEITKYQFTKALYQ